MRVQSRQGSEDLETWKDFSTCMGTPGLRLGSQQLKFSVLQTAGKHWKVPTATRGTRSYALPHDSCTCMVYISASVRQGKQSNWPWVVGLPTGLRFIKLVTMVVGKITFHRLQCYTIIKLNIKNILDVY